jgi:GT2 family glycosyltransferase
MAIDTAGDTYTRYGVAIKRGHHVETKRFLQEELVFGACGGAALYRRSMLDKVGFFDEDFFCVYEDVDLSFRAQLGGFKCLYVPTAIVYHKVGGTMGRNNDFILYYGQRNLEFVFIKNMPFSLLIKYLPLHMEYLLLALIYNLLRNKGGLFLRSKIDALKQIRIILNKRKQVQRGGKVSSHYLKTILYKRSLLKHLSGAI